MDSKVIELVLTLEQQSQLAPLVRIAAASRRNVIFIATAAPHIIDGHSIWRFQIVSIAPTTGTKVRRLLKAARETEAHSGGQA
ncbi:MAG: hypothetical protein JO313_15165 [Verrucomicrobia bacterium]|nr:hypothetical protein [Verrucomicrobiota bacterium]MBV9642891.1 hypothetical protein [Verrucomicrobiota bacterium]